MQFQNRQIRQYLRIFLENWWIILSIVLVGTGLAIVYSYAQTSIYEATATFVVNPGIRVDQTGDLLDSLDTLAGRTSLATTYSNILKSQVIIEAAAASLNVAPELLKNYDINAVVLPDSSVIRLQIQGPSPFLAADLANAIGTNGVVFVSDLQEIYELRHLDLATVDPDPISPDHFVDVSLGIIIALISGVSFAIIRQFLIQSFGEEHAGEEQAPSVSPTPVDVNDSNPQDVINDRNKATLQTNLTSNQPD